MRASLPFPCLNVDASRYRPRVMNISKRALVVLSMLFPLSAHAEAVRVGDTQTVSDIAAVKRLPHCAFDPTHDVYLVAWGINPSGARFVNVDGVPLGTPFPISSSDPAGGLG